MLTRRPLSCGRSIDESPPPREFAGRDPVRLVRKISLRAHSGCSVFSQRWFAARNVTFSAYRQREKPGNIPALDTPVRVSPSTVTSKDKLSRIGFRIACFQVSRFPVNVAPISGTVSESPRAFPVMEPLFSVKSRTTAMIPIGVAIVTSQVPAMMCRCSLTTSPPHHDHRSATRFHGVRTQTILRQRAQYAGRLLAQVNRARGRDLM